METVVFQNKILWGFEIKQTLNICFVFLLHRLVATSFATFSFAKADALYLTSHHVRISHRAVYGGGGCMNRNSCAASAKILDPIGIPWMGHLTYEAINSVLPKQAKTWGTALWGQDFIVSKQLLGINAKWPMLTQSIWFFTMLEYGTWPFYGGGCTWIETHAQQVQKYLTDSIPLMGCFRHQAINSVRLKQAKTWGNGTLRLRCHSKQTTARHKCQVVHSNFQLGIWLIYWHQSSCRFSHIQTPPLSQVPELHLSHFFHI